MNAIFIRYLLNGDQLALNFGNIKQRTPNLSNGFQHPFLNQTIRYSYHDGKIMRYGAHDILDQSLDFLSNTDNQYQREL